MPEKKGASLSQPVKSKDKKCCWVILLYSENYKIFIKLRDSPINRLNFFLH